MLKVTQVTDLLTMNEIQSKEFPVLEFGSHHLALQLPVQYIRSQSLVRIDGCLMFDNDEKKVSFIGRIESLTYHESGCRVVFQLTQFDRASWSQFLKQRGILQSQVDMTLKRFKGEDE